MKTLMGSPASSLCYILIKLTVRQLHHISHHFTIQGWASHHTNILRSILDSFALQVSGHPTPTLYTRQSEFKGKPWKILQQIPCTIPQRLSYLFISFLSDRLFQETFKANSIISCPLFPGTEQHTCFCWECQISNCSNLSTHYQDYQLGGSRLQPRGQIHWDPREGREIVQSDWEAVSPILSINIQYLYINMCTLLYISG